VIVSEREKGSDGGRNRLSGQRTRPGHVKSFGDERVCAEPNCLTVLSRYNGTSFCARHNIHPADRIWNG